MTSQIDDVLAVAKDAMLEQFYSGNPVAWIGYNNANAGILHRYIAYRLDTVDATSQDVVGSWAVGWIILDSPRIEDLAGRPKRYTKVNRRWIVQHRQVMSNKAIERKLIASIAVLNPNEFVKAAKQAKFVSDEYFAGRRISRTQYNPNMIASDGGDA